MALDVQQGLLEEGQSLDFVLLALVEHLLHALHVLRGALVELLQGLFILLFGLRRGGENNHISGSHEKNKKSKHTKQETCKEKQLCKCLTSTIVATEGPLCLKLCRKD